MRALVVENDPKARRRICKILTKKGIEVSACSSFRQGQEHFEEQALVLARAPEDGTELSGFVDWVRQRSGDHQPYIVAIDDAVGEADKMGEASANPGCNAVMRAPVDEGAIDERLDAIDQWLTRRGGDVEGEEPFSEGPETPFQPVQAPAVLPREAERYASVLVENAPVAMAMFDREMRYLVANRKWHEEFQLGEVPLTGRSHYDVFPNLPESWRQLFDRCLMEGVAERCEEDLFQRPNGTQDWVRWEVRPWHEGDGAVGGLMITSDVITDLHVKKERNRLEIELSASLMNQWKSPMMLVDFTGRIIRENAACEALFLLERMGREMPLYWELIGEKEAAEKEKRDFLEIVKRFEESGRIESPETRIFRLGGRKGVRSGQRYAWSQVPLVSVNGMVEGFIRFGMEVEEAIEENLRDSELAPMSPAAVPMPVGGLTREEWKQKERALVDERDLYARVAENAPWGILLIDPDGSLAYSNPQHVEVLGYDVKESPDVEAWLLRACPEQAQAKEMVREWREHVWRKQLPKVLSLATAEGLMKDIRFTSKLLADGKLLVSFSDVTEPQRLEEAYRSSEAKFRALFQGSRVGMALVDEEGKFFDINAALEGILGYPRWEIRAKALKDYVREEDAELVAALEPPSEGEETKEAEVQMMGKAGNLVRVRLSASPVSDHEGRFLFSAYTITDLSAQKPGDGEEKRESIVEETSALKKGIPDLVMMLDEEKKVVEMIPSTNRFLAVDAERMMREGFAREFQELAGKLDELIQEAHEAKGNVVHYDFKLVFEEDVVRRMEARLVGCGRGNTLLMIGDMTDRELAQESTARRALAFENNEDAIVVTDLKGRITDFNPAAERFFGYENGEIVGCPLYLLYEPVNPREFNQRISREMNANHRWEGRVKFQRKDGTRDDCDVLYVPVEAKGGKLKALLGTSRKATGGDRESGGTADDSAIRGRVSRVHGRVKNDLQILSGLLGLQLGSLPNQVGRRMLKENQNRILAISYIYRLLAEAEDEETIDFGVFLESLVDHLKRALGVNGKPVDIAIECEGLKLGVERAVPLGLIANELLANALEHGFVDGREGRVAVVLSREGGEVVLKIRDNGVGLPMTFDLEDPQTLGLQIVKILVDQLKGSIELLDSSDTEFHVRSPDGDG